MPKIVEKKIVIHFNMHIKEGKNTYTDILNI